MRLDGVDAQHELVGDRLVGGRRRELVVRVGPRQRDQHRPLAGGQRRRRGARRRRRASAPPRAPAPGRGTRGRSARRAARSPSRSRWRPLIRSPLTNVPLRERPSSATVHSPAIRSSSACRREISSSQRSSTSAPPARPTLARSPVERRDQLRAAGVAVDEEGPPSALRRDARLELRGCRAMGLKRVFRHRHERATTAPTSAGERGSRPLTRCERSTPRVAGSGAAVARIYGHGHDPPLPASPTSSSSSACAQATRTPTRELVDPLPAAAARLRAAASSAAPTTTPRTSSRRHSSAPTPRCAATSARSRSARGCTRSSATARSTRCAAAARTPTSTSSLRCSATSYSDPALAAERRETFDAVLAGMHDLPERQRTALVHARAGRRQPSRDRLAPGRHRGRLQDARPPRAPRPRAPPGHGGLSDISRRPSQPRTRGRRPR